MSDNPYAQYAKPQPPGNPYAQYGKPLLDKPFDILTDDLTTPPKPLTSEETQRGRGVVLANNLPGGEEMLVGTGYPAGMMQSAFGEPMKMLQAKLGIDPTGQEQGKYEAELGTARDLESRYWQENPQSAAGIGVAPGVGLGLLTGSGLINNAQPLLGKMALGAAEGAAAGGVYGYGAGEGGAENRAVEAGKGAAVGSLFGLTAPMVASGAGAAYRGIADHVSTNAALRGLGLGRRAGDLMLDTMSADQSLGPQGLANIRRGGRDAMVADAGPNAAGLLDLSMHRGGPGATRARQAVNQRAAGANMNLEGAFDQSFGPAQGVDTANTATRQGTAAARQAAYDLAENMPLDFTTPHGQELQRLARQVPQWAWDEAAQEIALRGEQTTPVRLFDRATRALNSAARRGERGGAMGGQTPLGDAAGQLSRDIRQQLRQAVPEYGHALDTAADPIREVQAREFGAALLSKATTRDQVATELQGMSQAERRAIGEGVRAHLDEIVADVNRTASDPNLDARQAAAALRAINSDAARAKVEQLLGQQEAGRLFQRMDEATSSLELRARVADNSKTFPRLAADRMTREMNDPGVVGKAAQGEFPGAFKRMVSTVTGQTPRRMLTRENQTFDEVVRALTERRGADAERFINQLYAAHGRRGANAATANAIQTGMRRMLTAPAGPAAYQTTR